MRICGASSPRHRTWRSWSRSSVSFRTGGRYPGQVLDLAGRSGRARTCDPRFWRPVLYQLSYTPAGNRRVRPVRAVSSIGHAPIARANPLTDLFKPTVLVQTSALSHRHGQSIRQSTRTIGRDHERANRRQARSQPSDPVAKFIPEFSDQKVGVENNGKLELVSPRRPMTVQDLLRHTSGITYDHTGNGLVQQLYQQSRLRSRKISNAEHAAMVASLPLMCQPGAEWNYSRSTDILGRVIEVVAGKSLGAFLTERILAPLQMAETAFHTGAENAGRLAQPFPNDPWS